MKKIIISLMIAILAAVGCVSFVACKPKGAPIGVQIGTTGESYLVGSKDLEFDGFSNIDCKGYANAGLAVQDMKNGKVKYVVVDEAPAAYLVKNIAGIKVIDVKLTDEEYAYGVNKADADLLAKVNTFLAKIKADGTFDGILNKYFAENANIQGITSAAYDANKPQLVVATSADFAPFEYKIGDKYAGIDMEIAQLMATEFGMELVIVDMDFDAVVTSVGNNGVDIAMAGLTVSDKRKESVNFADTYYNASQKIIALEGDTTFDACTTVEQVEAILKALKK